MANFITQGLIIKNDRGSSSRRRRLKFDAGIGTELKIKENNLKTPIFTLHA